MLRSYRNLKMGKKNAWRYKKFIISPPQGKIAKSEPFPSESDLEYLRIFSELRRLRSKQ